MSLVGSQTSENSVVLNIFFSAPATFFSLKGEKTHLGVLNVPLVVGCGQLAPMEVGGLEWLQEPFQPRCNGSSGLYLGVSKNKGTPKWMVYNGKPY